MSKIFKYFLYKAEKVIGSFFTFYSRPINSSNFNVFNNFISSKEKFAIIIQGPVIKEHNFTLETIKIYKKNFPNSLIILSTWDDSDSGYIEKIKTEKIIVLLNKKPNNPGISNINFQILSSLAGIKYAKEIGVEYVLKTRTDQRIYGDNVQDFLINIVKLFPVRNNSKQLQRIVGLSLNTFKYRPYSLSDMNLFGHINDMLLFWDVKFDERKKVDTNVSMAEWSKLRLCEVYLVSNFLEKIGHTLSWTLEDYWKILADNFCVVDQSILDLYWFKYERFKEYRHKDYKKIKSDAEVNFKDWIILYNNEVNLVPESTVDHNFNTEIIC